MELSKMLLLVVSLGFVSSLYSFSVTDSATTQTTGIQKIGFGIAFHDVYDLIATSSYETPCFFIPIHFKRFILEPTISYSRYTVDRESSHSYSRTTTRNVIGLGAFVNHSYPKTTIYYGIRVERGQYTENSDYVDPTEEDEEESFTIDVIKPTLGGQFFFTKHFSLGGELYFSREIHTYSKNYEDTLYYSYYSRIEQMKINTEIILRYYF